MKVQWQIRMSLTIELIDTTEDRRRPFIFPSMNECKSALAAPFGFAKLPTLDCCCPVCSGAGFSDGHMG
jgi:hypothetical protein